MDAGTLGYLDSRDRVFITTSQFQAQLFIRLFEIAVLEQMVISGIPSLEHSYLCGSS